MMRKTLLVLLAAFCAATGTAHAQSLFATRGLGAPLQPVDARAAALGGIPTGLLGLQGSLVNPADAGGVVRRGVLFAIQPSIRTVKAGDATDHISATRFPLINAYYPTSARNVFSLGYGGFLDQAWSVVDNGRELLGADSVRTQDIIGSTGGIAQVRLGVTRNILPHLWVGVSGGMYTGSLQRRVTRAFPDSATNGLRGFTALTEWSYRAPLVSAGLRIDAGEVARIGASVTWAGQLKANGQDSTAQDRTFDLPLQFSIGASSILAPRLSAAIGASYAGWSTAADDFRSNPISSAPQVITTARKTWSAGGGLEYLVRRSVDRSMPIRVGAHMTQYPFYLSTDAPINEKSIVAGLGWRLAGDEANQLANADFAVERGSRTGGPETNGIEESFWRLTVSLSLFGR